MLFPPTSDAFCAPFVIQRCGKNSSQCVHKKPNWLLQHCFQSGRSDSSSHATIGTEYGSTANHKEMQIRPNHSNHLWCAALATDSAKNLIQVTMLYITFALVYLTWLCVAVSTHQGRANLHSEYVGDLSVVANKGTICRRQSFAVSDPTTWNTLSVSTH